MEIRGKSFKDRTYIMGILNVTPDSFSDGGKWNTLDKALFRAEEILNEGGSIIDIGGESTRPGYEQISEGEEIERVTSVIEAVRTRLDLVISLDTYKSPVANAGIRAGADIINDIWGLRKDPEMKKVIADSGVYCVLMHNKDKGEYKDFYSDLVKESLESVDIAIKAGIDKNKIILDPGVGFAKTSEENLKVMNKLNDFVKDVELPTLLGTSRKSFIGNVLGLPVNERLEGTLVTTAVAIQAGCRFVRVHDVKENVRAAKMMEAICATKFQ